jgi:hypothetical protein
LGKFQVGVVIGHKKTGLGPADEEDHGSGFPAVPQLRQFFQMLLPPGGNRIREHGNLFAEESAGFDFQVDLFFPPLQEKIKPAVSMPDFPLDNLCPLQPGNHSFSEEILHEVIRPVGVGHDRASFPLDGHDRVGQFSPRLGGFFKVEDSPRQQKLPEPPRIGQKSS